VGSNAIRITITAESGARNVVTVTVTRKDGYYLEDLDQVLGSDEDADIILREGSTIISEQDVEKIKNSGKTISFIVNDKTIKYGWTIDGAKISEAKDFDAGITITDLEDNKDASKLSNYADGLLVSFNQAGAFIGGTTVRIYVGDKYSDGDLINIYYYEKEGERLESVASAVAVKDGYLEFGVEKGTDYVVTMSNVPGIGTSEADNTKDGDENKGFDVTPLLIVLLIVMTMVAVAGWFMFLKGKKHQGNNPDTNPKLSDSKPSDSESSDLEPSDYEPSDSEPSDSDYDDHDHEEGGSPKGSGDGDFSEGSSEEVEYYGD
jgi:hypothetical protein